MILEPAEETWIEIPLRESNPNLVMPGHSLHHQYGGPFSVTCARRYRLFEQLRRPTELRDRGVAILAADAPVQSVLGVVEHVLRRLKNAELHVPFRRGIKQDCRRPNREGIGGKARVEEHIPDVA